MRKQLPLKIDLHVHTCYSHDGTITLNELVYYAKKRGLNGVAITDHDTLTGALKIAKIMKNKKKLLIIPGIEISTRQGHILALNLTTQVPLQHNELRETIQRIHSMGGIAIATHPTSIFKGELKRCITRDFDALEVINSSAFPFHFSQYINRKIALKLGLPQTAGSDAHYAPEIGMAYTIIDANPQLDEIIEAIKKGVTVPCGRRIPWMIRLRREALMLKRV